MWEITDGDRRRFRPVSGTAPAGAGDRPGGHAGGPADTQSVRYRWAETGDRAGYSAAVRAAAAEQRPDGQLTPEGLADPRWFGGSGQGRAWGRMYHVARITSDRLVHSAERPIAQDHVPRILYLTAISLSPGSAGSPGSRSVGG